MVISEKLAEDNFTYSILSFSARKSTTTRSNATPTGTALSSGLSQRSRPSKDAGRSAYCHNSHAKKSAAQCRSSPSSYLPDRPRNSSDKMHYATVPAADEGGQGGVGPVRRGNQGRKAEGFCGPFGRARSHSRCCRVRFVIVLRCCHLMTATDWSWVIVNASYYTRCSQRRGWVCTLELIRRRRRCTSDTCCPSWF